jgi:hypothetical protein
MKEYASRSFLRDLVCLVNWIFLWVPRATYETCIRGEYVAIPNLLELVCIYKFLSKYLLDPKDLLFDDVLAFLHGNAGIDLWHISHVSGSKSVPSRSRFERSGGACLSPSYTSNWLFSKSRHLPLLSDSIKPWPMTLAPTNKTIRCEIMQRKDPKGKKSANMIWEYQC